MTIDEFNYWLTTIDPTNITEDIGRELVQTLIGCGHICELVKMPAANGPTLMVQFKKGHLCSVEYLIQFWRKGLTATEALRSSVRFLSEPVAA